MTGKYAPPAVTIRSYPDSPICGRAWNVRHTKFPNLIRVFRPMRKPTTCHFFCVQIEIDHLPAREAIADVERAIDRALAEKLSRPA
jgi:hypothetical protein